MTEISRSALFGKLNSQAYKAIEGATVLCKLRGNPYVELVHWIHQILQQPGGSDIHSIARAFELDLGKLARDMTEALDRLRADYDLVIMHTVHPGADHAWVDDAPLVPVTWSPKKFLEVQKAYRRAAREHNEALEASRHWRFYLAPESGPKSWRVVKEKRNDPLEPGAEVRHEA